MYLSKRRLIWHGVFLFLLGLLTGLVGEHFTNARLGLAAHLEGVMNGILLIALGGIWQEVRLSATSTKATFWLLLYGAYSNWLVTTMAAILGTSSMTPIAAAGRSAAHWQETLISIGFVSVALSILAASVLLLVGLRARAST
jgi:hydroxylaminobenzene mutase